jgi:TolB-like protein
MIYAFDEYTLDVPRRRLLRGQIAVKLEPQVFDILVFFVRNRDRVVTRNDLISEVWVGRIVSESTLNSRVAAVRKAIGDSGANQSIIKTMARKGYFFDADVEVREHADGGAEATPPGFPPIGAAPQRPLSSDVPSIAVLAFKNGTTDPGQEYFSDGVSEDLITALSRFGWLFVVARSSSFIYKDRAADVKQIGVELGVRYVLDGSIRRSGDRVRISAQLVDTSVAKTLWADHFDGAIADVFDLQDQLTASVVGAIAPKLELAEMARAIRKPTDRLDAYDLYLRGLSETYSYTETGYRNALALFRRSHDLDNQFAEASALASWCYTTCLVNGWMTDPGGERSEGIAFARHSVETANDSPVALGWGGFCLAWLSHDFTQGVSSVEKALAINPNFAAGWYLYGWLRVYQGDPERALEPFGRALELSPLDPLIFRAHAGIGHAHFFSGRFDDALTWVLKACSERQNWLTAVRGAAACYAVTGQIAEAQQYVARLRKVDPTRRISNLDRVLPLCRPQDRDLWCEALRNAGLPE